MTHRKPIQYNTIQYNAIQYNTIQCNTIQYTTIQYSTIQYSTIGFDITLLSIISPKVRSAHILTAQLHWYSIGQQR